MDLVDAQMKVNANAIAATVVVANAALPKAGGTMTGDTLHGDGVKSKFGTAPDLEIYHDGSHSYISEVGTGALKLKSDDFRVESASGTNLIKGVGDVASLYNAGNQKLATTSTGVSVTGTATANGLTATSTTTSGNLRVQNSASGATASDGVLLQSNSNAAYLWNYESGDMIFATANAEVMRIASGKVGVGATAPATDIHVKTSTAGAITSGAARQGSVIRLEHDANWESGYTGGDFLGGVEFYSGDDTTGEGVRTAIKTTVDGPYNQNSLAFYTAPSVSLPIQQRMVIDPSGNVGIGVTPATWHSNYDVLQMGEQTMLYAHADGIGNDSATYLGTNVYENSGAKYLRTDKSSLYRQQSGKHDFYVAPSGAADSAISWNNAMTIANDGNVGIGVVPDMLRTSDTALALGGTDRQFVTSSNHYVNQNNAKLDASGNPLRIIAAAATRYQMLSTGVHTFDVTGSGAAGSAISWTTAMTVQPSGNVTIGKTTTDFAPTGVNLIAAGEIDITCSAAPSLYLRRNTSDGIIQSFYRGGTNVGNISVTGSATAYNTSSDYRLKTDVQPMTGATATFMQLKPVNFEWIADGTRVDGFLAHELGEVIPAAATGSKDAMKDEEYEVSPATGDVYTAGSDAGFNEVSSAIKASPAYYDVDGNLIKAEVVAVAAVHEAFDSVDEVIHSSDVEQPETLEEGKAWRETTPQVMATRSVPDMQGIDQAKVVPLLVATLQEALARIEALEA